MSDAREWWVCLPFLRVFNSLEEALSFDYDYPSEIVHVVEDISDEWKES